MTMRDHDGDVTGFRVEGWFRGREIAASWQDGRLSCDGDLRAEAERVAMESSSAEPGSDALATAVALLRVVRATMVQIHGDQDGFADRVGELGGDPRLSLVCDGATPTVEMTVAGELDLVTGPRLRSAIPPMVPRRSRQVVLDLWQIGFCDVVGLGSLARLQRDLGDGGASLTLRRPSRAIHRILALTDERSHFDIIE